MRRNSVEITVTLSIDQETEVEVTGILNESDFKDPFKALQAINGIMNNAMQNAFNGIRKAVTGDGTAPKKELLGVRFTGGVIRI